MCIIEVIELLSEYKKYKSLDNLELASFNAILIQNNKADMSYTKILNTIIENEDYQEDLYQTYQRYQMICERLNLKYPSKEVN